VLSAGAGGIRRSAIEIRSWDRQPSPLGGTVSRSRLRPTAGRCRNPPLPDHKPRSFPMGLPRPFSFHPVFCRRDYLVLGILLAAVAVVWTSTYQRWTAPSWRVPVAYGGDAWFQLAAIEGIAESGAGPFARHRQPRLGAPIGSDWSDFPMYWDLVLWSTAQGARLVGLYPAANLAVLAAHLLAAASCFLVCRGLGADRSWSVALAGVYALSYYAFYRTLWHISMLHYWHLPLVVAVALRCLSARRPPLAGAALVGALAVAALTGMLEFYYTAIVGQFFGLAAIFQLVRRGGARRVFVPIVLGTAMVAGFLLTQVDTLSLRRERGPNPVALARNVGDADVLALRPVQLLLPYQHAWTAVQTWTRRAYWDTNPAGRNTERSTYLGVVGLGGLLVMMVVAVRRIIRRRPISWHAPLALWTLAFAVPGGISSVLLLFGWAVLRSNNRVSIVLLTLTLLYLAVALTAATRRWPARWRWVAATMLFALGAWDQARHPPAQRWPAIGRTIAADDAFARELEKAVGSRHDVFMLPAIPFPEAGSDYQRGFIDYEHLRLFLSSHRLRLSYGGVKGRPEADATVALGQLPPAELGAAITRGEWGAVAINRKGLADGGAAILASLEHAGWTRRIENSLGDLVAVLPAPAANSSR
jgi:phosphoglycerol transferase